MFLFFTIKAFYFSIFTGFFIKKYTIHYFVLTSVALNHKSVFWWYCERHWQHWQEKKSFAILLWIYTNLAWSWGCGGVGDGEGWRGGEVWGEVPISLPVGQLLLTTLRRPPHPHPNTSKHPLNTHTLETPIPLLLNNLTGGKWRRQNRGRGMGGKWGKITLRIQRGRERGCGCLLKPS